MHRYHGWDELVQEYRTCMHTLYFCVNWATLLCVYIRSNEDIPTHTLYLCDNPVLHIYFLLHD
jgi:hypothetical protein